MVKVKKNKKLISRNRAGVENGYVIPIVDVADKFPDSGRFPHQVYLTVVAPGEIKGPHHHKIRYAMYTCIKGNIKVVVKKQDTYEIYYSGENHDFATIWVEKGLPTALINLEKDRESMIVNTPNPSYQECPNDEHEVEFDPKYLRTDD
ncbi:MAG: cupin domain-containing protein [Candidatus Cloacimonetes bacterium]|nr:cupin domain-containing protein [Candidatus Cloacimonadota bacterium]